MTLKQQLKKFLKENSRRDASFTLIELVIVIGILAILAVVVIIVLNPSEFLRQARDSTRISDLQTLNSAIGQYQADGGTSLGFSNTVYVSIPSSQDDCSDLGLPSLPDDWFYACSNSDNYRKVDSNGWIPVPFSSISYGNVLNILPIDPINTTSTGNYYMYITGGSWELDANLESQTYRLGGSKDVVSKAGQGNYLYKVGSNINLSPFSASGLVGYWKFDEGSGSTAGDSSGNNNTGTLTNGPTWITGKVGNALSFDGSDDIVFRSSSSGLNTFTFTVTAWIKQNVLGDYGIIRVDNRQANDGWNIAVNNNGEFRLQSKNVSNTTNGANFQAGQWYYVAATYTLTELRLYVNGVNLLTTNPADVTYTSTQIINIGSDYDTGYSPPQHGMFFTGLIDDVRIYNRALSAAEIAAIYNATK